MPPPVPVDSTIGAAKSPARAKFSAASDEKGNTVDEPTTRTWSRVWAMAAPAVSATEAATVARSRVFFIWKSPSDKCNAAAVLRSFCGGRRRPDPRQRRREIYDKQVTV